MKLILAGQGCGKTTRAIELARETDSYIICPTQADAYRIARMDKEMMRAGDQRIRFPVTLDQLLKRGGLRGFRHFGLIFDDMDRMLQMLAGRDPVIAATWTEEATGEAK